MQVLVAGSTGNTGQRLVRELHERGLNPLALVRESPDTSGLPHAGPRVNAGITQNITEGHLIALVTDATFRIPGLNKVPYCRRVLEKYYSGIQRPIHVRRR